MHKLKTLLKQLGTDLLLQGSFFFTWQHASLVIADIVSQSTTSQACTILLIYKTRGKWKGNFNNNITYHTWGTVRTGKKINVQKLFQTSIPWSESRPPCQHKLPHAFMSKAQMLPNSLQDNRVRDDPQLSKHHAGALTESISEFFSETNKIHCSSVIEDLIDVYFWKTVKTHGYSPMEKYVGLKTFIFGLTFIT